jgi:hypothetical protein
MAALWSRVPALLLCDTDEEAIQQAKKLLNGSDIELWDGARLVTRLISSDLR